MACGVCLGPGGEDAGARAGPGRLGPRRGEGEGETRLSPRPLPSCGGQPHGPADWAALPSPGARCEANTFDGERCLYGAQSEAIRRALRDYKQVTASYRRRDYYYSCLLR